MSHILLLYSARSEVNRGQVVLSGFSVRLLCFVQAKLYVCIVVCISWLHSCLCVCVYIYVIVSSA